MRLRKFFKYVLPLAVIALSVVLVVVMVTVAKGKRPERKDTSGQALMVEAIPAQVESLNFSVYSQGAVKPRTETTLVAEVAGRIVSVSCCRSIPAITKPGCCGPRPTSLRVRRSMPTRKRAPSRP
jgi:multidrug efflux pump subunit AcrA (membrane-fusion protein)